MVRRVDIKYKNEFRHKACFTYLLCRLEIQIILHIIV